MELKSLESKIKRYAINPVEGKEWYFDYPGIIEVTKLCIKYKTIILGYEGFDQTNEDLIPDMEAILDNSSKEKLSLEKIEINFFNKIKNPEKKIWTIVFSSR